MTPSGTSGPEAVRKQTNKQTKTLRFTCFRQGKQSEQVDILCTQVEIYEF